MHRCPELAHVDAHVYNGLCSLYSPFNAFLLRLQHARRIPTAVGAILCLDGRQRRGALTSHFLSTLAPNVPWSVRTTPAYLTMSRRQEVRCVAGRKAEPGGADWRVREGTGI